MAYMLAQGWLLLQLTDSPLMVGLAPGLSGITNLFLSPLGGVLADRFNRRNILVIGHAALGAAMLALGALTLAGMIQVWHVLLVSSLQGVSRAIQGPARNSLMYDVVGRSALVNAMAGQFIAFHVASIVAAFPSGLIMAAFGPGPVIVGVGIFLVGAALLLLPLPQMSNSDSRQTSPPLWESFTQGLSFALHDRPIRAVLATILVTESLGYSSRSMFPIVARDVLLAGPAVLGLLATLWSVGGVIVAITLSGIGDMRSKGRVFVLSASAFGAMLLLFSFSRSLPLSLALLFLAGGFGVAYDTMATTLLQTLSPDYVRGRVMGLYSTLLSGLSIGALVMGALADVWGVTTAIAIGGGLVLLNALRMIPTSGLISARSEPVIPTTVPR